MSQLSKNVKGDRCARSPIRRAHHRTRRTDGQRHPRRRRSARATLGKADEMLNGDVRDLSRARLSNTFDPRRLENSRRRPAESNTDSDDHGREFLITSRCLPDRLPNVRFSGAVRSVHDEDRTLSGDFGIDGSISIGLACVAHAGTRTGKRRAHGCTGRLRTAGASPLIVEARIPPCRHQTNRARSLR